MKIRFWLTVLALFATLLTACEDKSASNEIPATDNQATQTPAPLETVMPPASGDNASNDVTNDTANPPGASDHAAGVAETDRVFHAESEPLFTGDAKKYQPFVGAMSGGVKFSYSGEKKQIGVDVELWENGHKQKTIVSSYSPMHVQEEGDSQPYEGELIAAITERNTDGKAASYEVKFSIVDAEGTVTNTFETEKMPSVKLTGTLALGEPATGTEETGVAVWGMQATDEGSLRSTGSVDEDAQKAKYAIVFRIVSKG